MVEHEVIGLCALLSTDRVWTDFVLEEAAYCAELAGDLDAGIRYRAARHEMKVDRIDDGPGIFMTRRELNAWARMTWADTKSRRVRSAKQVAARRALRS